jgi:hypothetical protein
MSKLKHSPKSNDTLLLIKSGMELIAPILFVISVFCSQIKVSRASTIRFNTRDLGGGEENEKFCS